MTGASVLTGNISSENASSRPLAADGRPLTHAHAAQRLRLLLSQPALFDPDVKELRILCRVLGVRLKIRRVDLADGDISEYVIP